MKQLVILLREKARGRVLYRPLAARGAFTIMLAALLGAVCSARGPEATATASTKSETNIAQGDDFKVTVTRAEPLTTKDGARTGFLVSYRYDFRNQQSVELEGIGEVPAKGEFSHILFSPTLTFKPVRGGLPVTVEIKATRRPEGGSGLLEMPAEGDFGSAALNETRTTAANFFESVSRLFNREFISGYRVNQVGGTNQYVTTFRALQGVPENLRAEIAVMVSHSTATSVPPVPFRLQYLVRQKPKRSEKWDYGIQGLEQQVNPFVTGLLARLKTE
jgi:hypothetical protein